MKKSTDIKNFAKFACISYNDAEIFALHMIKVFNKPHLDLIADLIRKSSTDIKVINGVLLAIIPVKEVGLTIHEFIDLIKKYSNEGYDVKAIGKALRGIINSL